MAPAKTGAEITWEQASPDGTMQKFPQGKHRLAVHLRARFWIDGLTPMELV
jgi:hypothetical protein